MSVRCFVSMSISMMSVPIQSLAPSFSEGNKGAANVEEREYGIRPREETMNVPREWGGECQSECARLK